MHLEGIEVWIEARDKAKDAVYEEYKDQDKEEVPKEELPDPRYLAEHERDNLEELLERYRVRWPEENTPDFEHKRSTCYIEARSGTTFKIRIRIMKSFNMHSAAALRLCVAIDNEWEFGYTANVTKEELQLALDGGSMVGEVIYDVDYDNGNKHEMRFEEVGTCGLRHRCGSRSDELDIDAEEGKGKGKGKAQSSEPLHMDVENRITVVAQRVVTVPNDEIIVLPTRSPALHASRMARYLDETRVLSQYVKPCLAGRLGKGFKIPPENWKPLGYDAWKQDNSIWWDPTGDKQLGRPYIFEFRYRSKEQLQALDLVSMRDKKEDDGKKNGDENAPAQNKEKEEKEGSDKENEEPSGGDSNNDRVEDQDNSEDSSDGSWEEHELPPLASIFGQPNDDGHLNNHDEIIATTSAIATRSVQARVVDLESQDPGVTVLFQNALDEDEAEYTVGQHPRDRYLTDVGDIVVLTLAIAAVSSQMGVESTFEGLVVYYDCSVEAKQQVMRITNM